MLPLLLLLTDPFSFTALVNTEACLCLEITAFGGHPHLGCMQHAIPLLGA